MRCSKCQYISFDNSDRCRNCGYEFSLAADVDALDLPIRTGDEPSGPLSDFSLADLDTTPTPAPPAPEPPPARAAAPARPAPPDLPLFGMRGRDDDAPLVSLPASPRAPVAVRKSTRPALRPVQEPELDLGPTDDEDDETAAIPPMPTTSRRAAPLPTAPAPDGEVAADVAPLLPRIGAGLIDLLLLGSIDVVVLYFTLKLCGLGFDEATLIPIPPFAAFVALLNGGYFAAFTAAGGQTIGKMLTHIKVVTSEEGAWTDRVPVGPAALRAFGYLMSALPAGLGFLPVLIGADRRGLHDRLAHTRVVRA